MAPLPMTIRCRLIGATGGFRGLLDERGCGRVGPYIARAVHNPGQWGSGRGVAKRLLSDELLGSLPPKSPQQTLHGRMLSRPELLGMFLAQPADDGECSQLRLRSEPVLDRGNVRVELRRHANPRLVRPMGSPVRGTRIVDLRRRAERLRESGCIRRRAAFAGTLLARGSGTTSDTT